MAATTEHKEVIDMLSYIIEHMATKEDLAEGLFALQTQVNSIEENIREMKRDRLPTRMADVEEKLFGKPRS